MKWFAVFIVCTALAAAGPGCSKPPPTAATPPAAMPPVPTKAQPKLATMKLWIGSEETIAELALSPVQEQTGMMFRTNMADNESMLFVFPEPTRAGFWMKNTSLPLTAAYIAPDGSILELHYDFKPFDTNTVFAASDNVLYVLESPPGWYAKHHISVGTVVTTEHGPLQKVFVTQH